MANDKPMLDVELEDLPPELRWREWMGRIEAVIFASASPVSREDLARVVGQGASVDLLIEDVVSELKGRPYELMAVADGWLLRTRVQFAQAIQVAADVNEQLMDLNEFEVAVLAAVAYHQPLTPRRVKGNLWQGHQPRFDWPVKGAGVDHHRAAQPEGRGTLYLCDHAAVSRGV